MQAPSSSRRPLSVHWEGLTPYPQALADMEQQVQDVLNGGADRLIFCEHPPVITVGTSGNVAGEILDAGEIPVIASGRGGKVTYHGPGQRVVYPIIDLRRLQKEPDLRAYVLNLQAWLILVLAKLGIEAHAGQGDTTGVWVGTAKIAAIGIRVRRWVAFHGIALNIDPDLAAFNRIIPCGFGPESGKTVTSLAQLGHTPSLKTIDDLLKDVWNDVFMV